MKYEDKKILVVSILMIAILSFFTYRNFTNLKNIGEVPSFPQEIPGVDIPSLDEMMPANINDLMREYGMTEESAEPEKIEYTSYKIPGVALFEYPSHWKKMDLDAMVQQRDLLNIIFVAHSRDIIQPTMVVVSEIKADNPEESIGIMEDIFRLEGATMNFIKKTETENGLYLEVDYKYEDGKTMRSKEKLLRVNDKFYLFSVVVHLEKFEANSLQVDHIINSIQIIE